MTRKKNFTPQLIRPESNSVVITRDVELAGVFKEVISRL